jgi:hypothetical protein
MKGILIGFYLAIIIFIFSACKHIKKDGCEYTMDNLLSDSTIKFSVKSFDDTLFAVSEVVEPKTPSSSIYVFDRRKLLKEYYYLYDDTSYKVHEFYNNVGQEMDVKGSPIVNFEMFYYKKDTITVNGWLFSLHKKFDGIRLIIDRTDSLDVSLLYKNEKYANMKYFTFDIPNRKIDNRIEVYIEGSYLKTCNRERIDFVDSAELIPSLRF